MLRRALLRLALRLRRPGSESMIAALPDEALLALRRDGLDPVLVAGQEKVRPVSLPWGFRGWLVLGYDEARAVLADHVAFSNDFGHLVGRAGMTAAQDPGGLGFTDPPYHTRLRHLLTPHFTAQRLKSLEPAVAAIVDTALNDLQDALAADGVADLVQHVALPVPSLTICALLGVPYADRAEFQRLSTARFRVGEGTATSLGQVSESLDYLEDLVRRRRRDPGDGLLGELVSGPGADLSDRELAGVADGVLTGGLETTASMLALGAMLLLQRPDHRDRLVRDEPFVAAYVEELLRYLSVVSVAFPRFARQDVDLAGTRIRSGDVVLCSLVAADRDQSVGDRPDVIDPDLPRRSHLAFGHGIHRCVGAELARLELRLALPELCRRLPDLRLAPSPDGPEFRELSVVYGVAALPVTRGG